MHVPRLATISRAVRILRDLAVGALALTILGVVRHETPRVDALISESTLTAKNLREASAQWRDASAAQSKAATDSEVKLNATLDSVNQAVRDFNRGSQKLMVAGQVALEHITLATDDLAKQGSDAVVAIQQQAAALAPVAADAHLAMAQAIKVLGDPAIPETLGYIRDTARESAGVTADTHHVTTVIAGKVDDAAKPRGKVKSAFSAIKNFLEIAFYIHSF